jgi:Short C-terminal domain
MWRYVRLWRHLIGVLTVFLFGGLVGPIFLAIYFLTGDLTGDEDDLAWMLWVGAAITVGSVLLGLVAGHFIGVGVAKIEQSQQRRALLRQWGVLALAQVMGYSETGVRINDRPVVRVNLRVERQGLAPFDTEARFTAGVTAMPILAARRLVVLMDPATRECEIDLQASALVSGVMPMQLAVAEDNRTYDITGQAGPVMEILQVLRANGIPFGGSFDLRSNPVVREQVVEILRQNAAAQLAVRPGEPQFSPAAAAPNPAPAWLPPPPPPSAAQRLQELETLRATGAITESEYAAKRRQVIAEL